MLQTCRPHRALKTIAPWVHFFVIRPAGMQLLGVWRVRAVVLVSVCFAIHPSGFPCAYAGSDGCPVFTRETSPVKSCGLYTDAALRGRLVPLEEVHLAEIQA